MYNSPIFLRIGQSLPESAPPEIRMYLEPVYNAFQQLQQAFIQYAGIAPLDPAIWSQATPRDSLLIQNMGRCYGKATENIASGALIHVVGDGLGGYSFRNANATDNTKPAYGFCSTVGGILAAAYGEVILGRGLVTSSALTIGAPYFLSTTNGLVTAAAPAAPGNIEQFVGFAFTASLFMFTSHYWIQH